MADISPIIEVRKVSKSFKLPHERTSSVKGVVLGLFRKQRFEMQRALKDVSFQIQPGEFFGIVGRNGSGKSTLLKMLAGIYSPTTGHIAVNGKLTPFIELGVGFNPELTGRENVFLNGALLGFSRKEMSAMYDDIVAFAELERFMDQKLKNYSSGMQVRLAFSVAIRASSDILLIDEVLAVGDAAFQKKCFEYFMLLKKNRKTVVLVTHDMEAVRQYCDRAILIDSGVVVKEGEPETIANAYHRQFFEEFETGTESTKTKRWGTGKLKAQTPKLKLTPEHLTISVKYTTKEDIPAPVLGFSIFDAFGNNVLEGNTLRQKQEISDMKKGDTVEIIWEVPNIFATGNYSVTVACCDRSAIEFYDWFDGAATFKVSRQWSTAGAVDPPLVIKSFNKVK